MGLQLLHSWQRKLKLLTKFYKQEPYLIFILYVYFYENSHGFKYKIVKKIKLNYKDWEISSIY